MTKKEVESRSIIEDAIYKNILTKEGGSIFYGGDRIGFDKEEAVEYLVNPKNQKLYLRIMEKVND